MEKAEKGETPRSHTTWLWSAMLAVNCLVLVPMWSMLLFLAIYAGLLHACWPYQPVFYALLSYIPWIIFDRGGGTVRSMVSHRVSQRLRHFFAFGLVKEYFPVALHKTTDLHPTGKQSYIFTYHPHGIIGMGCNTALNTNACGFDTAFPGIHTYGVTLNAAFTIPFFREWISALGFVGADRRVLAKTLSSGVSIVLVPGGSSEALLAAPGTFVLKRRQGFVRLALETGAHVVPCLAFGENDAFRTVQFPADSRLFAMQQRLCKLLSFSTPILTSPFCVRHPIDVVVGEPIVFDAANSTKSVQACTDQYCAAVDRLYAQHKHKYRHGDVTLEWI